MEYQIDLDTFRGPLDLLLYLVKRDEIDICDIPIARVTEQFLEHLRVIQMIDVERAGDFLVMAATLMEIKSRMLLPRAEETEGEDDDPRQELVRQLIEYKKFKDAAVLLEARAEQQFSHLSRQSPPTLDVNVKEQPLRAVELWDLVSAFGRLMRETLALQPRQIVMDETPLQIHIDGVLQRLQTAARLPFASLFTPPHSRGRLLGLFLAMLELIKSGRITVEQPEPFGEIWLNLAPPPPTEISPG